MLESKTNEARVLVILEPLWIYSTSFPWYSYNKEWFGECHILGEISKWPMEDAVSIQWDSSSAIPFPYFIQQVSRLANEMALCLT